MKEYYIAFVGNITIYAESEAEARKAFDTADLRPWAEIDTVHVTDENPTSDVICPVCRTAVKSLRHDANGYPQGICQDCWETSI